MNDSGRGGSVFNRTGVSPYSLEAMSREELIAEIVRLTEVNLKPVHDSNDCHVCATIKAKREAK